MIKDQLNQWLSMEVWRLPQWYTRVEIAREIGCGKSPSLIHALDVCVNSNILESIRTKDEHGRDCIKYRITDDYREDVFDGALKNAKQ